ncbi:MAG: mechanosensitive ion channel [Myxococcota bacterium]
MDGVPLQLPHSVDELVVGLVSATMGMAWNVVAALTVFVLGFFAAGFLTRFLRRLLIGAYLDATLVTFLTNLLYYGLVALVIITALSKLGVETTQFIAVIGAAGLAVGLALEGALSNFAAGVLIIVFRPFRVGDYVVAGDAEGYVEGIEMVVTVLKTLENEIVIIPNSEITGSTVKNLSRLPYVLLEIPFVVGHDASLDVVLAVLAGAPDGVEHILSEPAPRVAVVRMDRDGVHLQLEVPIRGGDHEDVQYALVERVKRGFDAAGVRPARSWLSLDPTPVDLPRPPVQ